MEDLKGFGARLSQRMKERGLSQEAMTIKTGISSRMIRRYQKGENTPTAYSLGVLAKALCVTVDWLIGEKEDENDGSGVQG